MMTSSLSFPPPLACADVDRRLADYLDDEPPGALTPTERAAVDRHVAACDRCGPLVADLRAVTRTAAALPPLAPPSDLWAGIAARLGAQETAHDDASERTAVDAPVRVLPFAIRHVHRPARTAPGAERAHGVTWSRRGLAAAAVALVAVTAGTTYLIARPAPATPGSVASAPAVAPNDRSTLVAGVTPDSASDVVTPGTPAPEARMAALPSDEDRDGAAARRAARPAERREPRPTPVVAVADAGVPGADAYDREIAALRAAVRDRRGDLDSATVAVLVRNLTIIDRAIAQSRAALARDPHSQFLGDQLTRALGQKVDLLRTAALMPRT
jgi:hypothetical protein